MLAESLLIAALIILILYLSGYGMKDVKRLASSEAPKVAADGAATPPAPAAESYEEKIAEHQSNNMKSLVAADNGSNFALGGSCPEADQIDFAVNEFGAPGLDYQAWVGSQAVDDQVIKNHVDFVANIRGLGPNGTFTGRTYSPDSHDSYDPIPWIGLRRPEFVNIQNPTSFSDTDYSLYLRNRNFCLKT